MFKFQVDVDVWDDAINPCDEPDRTITENVWAKNSDDAEQLAEEKVAQAYLDSNMVLARTPRALQTQ